MLRHATESGYEETVARAKKNASAIIGYFSEYSDRREAVAVCLLIIASFTGADGDFDDREYRFLCDVFGFDYEKESLGLLVRAYGKNSTADRLDDLMDRAPAEIREAFIALGVDICAINGGVSVEEKALIEKYADRTK